MERDKEKTNDHADHYGSLESDGTIIIAQTARTDSIKVQERIWIR